MLKLSPLQRWRLARLRAAGRLWWMRLAELPPPARFALLLILLVLVASLAGCGTTSAPSSFTPRNPEPPPTTLSERSVPWSQSAAQLLSKWRKQLIGLTASPVP
jgi:predicted small lipoprotein YifL